MTVKKDASGHRSVEAEVEVPGAPEDVWNAIATGPGLSAWFVPSENEGRVGGKVVCHFASDGSMDSIATITAWAPPKRFVAETQEGPGTVATEWIVEAKSGNLCTVRVVHSWFASTDDWDDQFDGHRQGWIAFFRLLRLYLAHFKGEPASAFQLLAVSPESPQQVWEKLTGSLGLKDAAEQQRVRAPSDAPSFGGVVERVGSHEHPELVMRLDQPAPALVHIFPLRMGGQTFLSVRFFIYGDKAAAIAEQERSRWQEWLAAHFPTPSGQQSA